MLSKYLRGCLTTSRLHPCFPSHASYSGGHWLVPPTVEVLAHASYSGGDWQVPLELTVPRLCGDGLIQTPLQHSGRGRSVWFISYLFYTCKLRHRDTKTWLKVPSLQRLGWDLSPGGICVLVNTLCYFCMGKMIFWLFEELGLGHITTAFHR